jgi:ABC-2 type transport system permease protein
MVLYIVATITFGNLGFEHKPLHLRRRVTDVPISDMNGQGKFWIGAWWLRLYWSAFAVVLLVLAYGLWRRGTESRLWPRLRACPPADRQGRR